MLPREQRLNKRPLRKANGAIQRPHIPEINIDLLLEIPNLGLADGYGQSARSIVKMLIEICEEEGLSIRVVNKRNLCGPIDRASEIDVIKSLLIEPTQVGNVKVFLRYALPELTSYNAQRFIAMTMFETDTVPPKWIPALNNCSLVITPTEWGAKVFSSFINPPVVSIPLPVNQLYYRQQLEDTLLPKGSKFRFLTVGNYFQPDRKRIIPLIKAFGERFKDRNCELYVKSSWTDRGSSKTIPIDVVCKQYDNVILDTQNIDTPEMVKMYCNTHAALFCSYGEGYGLPHVEASLLGRPLVVSDNTSLMSMAKLMPWVFTVECKPVPANYTPQQIDNAGNWFECDMDKFLDKADMLLQKWERDPKAYNEFIVQSHRSQSLSYYVSHHNIKELFRIEILKQMKECK